jgi:hypothetical protein
MFIQLNQFLFPKVPTTPLPELLPVEVFAVPSDDTLEPLTTEPIFATALPLLLSESLVNCVVPIFWLLTLVNVEVPSTIESPCD